MGIRFACPNGHPLHVKAELAGKRGICPECQVRFTIPQPSTADGLASANSAAASNLRSAPEKSRSIDTTAAPSPAAAADKPASAPAAAPTNPPPEPAASPPAAWYIRPAGGGQYGPADDQLLQQWTSEGRVAADSYVWRTGWPDWRLVSEMPEYFPQLAGSSQPAAATPPSDYNGAAEPPAVEAPAESEASLATARYRRRKMQSARGQQLAAVLLILLTVVLAGVLAWVLLRTPETEDESAPGRLAPGAEGGEPAQQAAE